MKTRIALLAMLLHMAMSGAAHAAPDVTPESIMKRPDLAALPAERQEGIYRLLGSSEIPVGLALDHASGAVIRLSGLFPQVGTGEDGLRRLLAEQGPLFGLEAGLEGWEIDSVEETKTGARMRLRQSWNGVPVFGGAVVAEFDAQGRIEQIASRIVPVEKLDASARIGEDEARATALAALGVEEKIPLSGTLTVLDRGTLLGEEPEPRLAWQFAVAGPDVKLDVFVDATDGSHVWTNSNSIVTDGPGDISLLPVPQTHVNPRTGVPNFVTFGQNGLWLPESASNDPARVALAFFRRHPLVFGTGDVPRQLVIEGIERDAGPPHLTHVRLQQVFGGVPVFGAQLRVHLSPALTITSISGNYVRDPQVVPVARAAEPAALAAAERFLLGTRYATGSKEDPAGQGKAHGLWIYPGQLSTQPDGRTALAWRFSFPEAEIFVADSDAQGENVPTVLAAIPTRTHAGMRLVRDALGASELSLPPLVVRDGINVSGMPLNADAAAADALILTTRSFFSGLGRTSFDNRNSDIVLVTNSSLALTGGCPNAHWDAFRNEMWFCLGTAVGDIVGHEFTHGVNRASAGLIPLDESGALDEHYADVLGELAFFDVTNRTWTLGESATAAGFPVRDLRNATSGGALLPLTYAQYVPRPTACLTPFAVLTNPACDFGGVHTNLSIGNRAAVLLEEGQAGTTHTGIGTARLARLFHDTLTTRLHPWSTYTEERLNTWETARDFAARGVTVTVNGNGLAGFAGVSREVSWAFSEVGVDPRLIPGWHSVAVGVSSGAGTDTWYSNRSMDPCWIVGDVILQVRAFDPFGGRLPWWQAQSSVLGSGGIVTFPGGVFGATVVAHGIGSANMAVTVSHFHSGFLPLEIRPVIVPARDPSPACTAAPPPPPLSELVTRAPTHWSFILGGKGDDDLNVGMAMRDAAGNGCRIDDVQVELLDRSGNVFGPRTTLGSPDAVVRYGPANALSWGARLNSASPGTSDPQVQVHWWFDIGVANRYQVRYYATGEDCSIAP